MDDCIFCKLANGDIPTDMVYQDDLIAVFRDAAPQAPVHMLMVPKIHVASLDDLTDEHAELMAHMMLKIKRYVHRKVSKTDTAALSIRVKTASRPLSTCTSISLASAPCSGHRAKV